MERKNLIDMLASVRIIELEADLLMSDSEKQGPFEVSKRKNSILLIENEARRVKQLIERYIS
jgi:hypothetical protein